MLSDGEYGIIKGIKRKELSEPETTYNFEVADFHTYFVGMQGILVHNVGCVINDFYNNPEKLIGKNRLMKLQKY